MKIVKRLIEEIKLESYVPYEIINKGQELMKEGYNFTPVKNYMDSKNQTVYYSTGIKEISR